MLRRPRPYAPSFGVLAVLPAVILSLSIAYVAQSSLLRPLPRPAVPPSTEQSEPPEEMEEPHLPYLLYSASDLPPLAPDVYDILYATDPSLPPTQSGDIPPDCFPIVSKNLCRKTENGSIPLSNETKFSPNTAALAEMAWKGELPAFSQTDKESEPLVLIFHTHGTEAFAEEGASYVSPSDTFRSDDTEKNVVAVGKALANALATEGISSVHCTVMHDKGSYSDAYTRAKKTIAQYLEKYPSIRYVLDVHRDSIVTTDGTHIKPVATAPDGSTAAQVMLVIGTNQNGANHPNWENNLALACKLQLHLQQTVDQFARPINLRKSSFNGQYSDGAMLVEIGSAANTLEEAKNAAVYFASALSTLIRELGSK